MHPRAAKMRLAELKLTFREQSAELTNRIVHEEDPVRRLLIHAEIGVLVDRFMIDLDKIITLLPAAKKGLSGQAGTGAGPDRKAMKF